MVYVVPPPPTPWGLIGVAFTVVGGVLVISSALGHREAASAAADRQTPVNQVKATPAGRPPANMPPIEDDEAVKKAWAEAEDARSAAAEEATVRIEAIQQAIIERGKK